MVIVCQIDLFSLPIGEKLLMTLWQLIQPTYVVLQYIIILLTLEIFAEKKINTIKTTLMPVSGLLSV